jgi:signal transduction histidine kinase
VPSTPFFVCLSTSAHSADILRDIVQALMPTARVDSADTSVLRHLPTSDGIILSVGSMYQAAESMMRELRARGNGDPVLVVADDLTMLPNPELRRFGVSRFVTTDDIDVTLPGALEGLLREGSARRSDADAERLHDVLRHVHALLAAGQLAVRLQHRLNNPLAALLAEAQLLELEPLTPDVAASVQRMVELCRRVIEETRSIDGLANAVGGPA